MNILVVAAHPDDEILACGGTIARLAREGQSVHIATLGEGIKARFRQPEEADPALVQALRADSRAAAECVGARDLFQYDFPDNRFDTVPLLDIVKTIEDLIERVRPDAVYTHHGGDLNLDHAITHRATITATRPTGGCSVKELYACEVASATEWSFGQFQPPFQPNVFVDITSTIETKIDALGCYRTEVREFPHPRSPEALRATARRWGSMAGAQYAEAFHLIRAIR